MSSTETGPRSKVARLIDEHGLDGMGEYLEKAWTGVDGSRTSLRDLADEFNTALLAAILRNAGESMTEYDIETTYRVLTDDDVSNADILRKERGLERAGVSVDELRDSFVTHQAIHTYLTRYREAELDDVAVDPQEKVETLERLEGRTAAVAESTLSSLVEAEEITERNYELFVEIRTVCEDCGSDYSLVDLIAQGGCDCETEADA